MTNEEQIKRGVRSAMQVITAWLESDDPAADASFAERQIKAIRSQGDIAGGDLVIGLMALSGNLLDQLSETTGKSRAEILQAIALRAN